MGTQEETRDIKKKEESKELQPGRRREQAGSRGRDRQAGRNKERGIHIEMVMRECHKDPQRGTWDKWKDAEM